MSKLSVNVNWFSKHNFSKYRGKYVAVVGEKVVASGSNAKRVWEDAKKKYPKESPALAKIPDKETYVLL